MRVAVITVGDEILSGDITNTNAAWLGARLTERGVDVERMVTLPDRVTDIARVVNERRAEYDAVVVTGGLGPTHDDCTMDGVAAAFGVPLEEHEDAVRWITDHTDYERADLTEGTTHLPRGARMLPNEVGVAPGCVIGHVYVLPGVPAEMKAMFEHVATEFSGKHRYTQFLFTDEPESSLIERFATLRERFDVKVGSYPSDVVRIKLQSTDEEAVERATAWLRARLQEVEPPVDYR